MKNTLFHLLFGGILCQNSTLIQSNSIATSGTSTATSTQSILTTIVSSDGGPIRTITLLQSVTSAISQPTSDSALPGQSQSTAGLSTEAKVGLIITGVVILALGVGIYAFRTFGLQSSEKFRSRLKGNSKSVALELHEPNEYVYYSSHGLQTVQQHQEPQIFFLKAN